jgi:PAS domain S-box-containing protein
MTQEDALFNQLNQSIMLRTMEGMINFWNHSAEKLYGWKKDEAIGRVSHDLLQTRFPKPLREIESELLQKGRWEGKLVHTTRDGGRVVVESRWILDRAGESEAIVEINEPASDAQEEPEVGKLPKAGGFPLKIANIILAGGACLCILMASYWIYRSEWYWSFPAAMAGLVLLALRLPPSFRIRLALILFSTTVSIYAAEILTTLVDIWSSLPPVAAKRDRLERARMAKQFGVNFDVRSNLEVTRDLRSKGVDAYPAISPIGLLLDSPISLVQNRPDPRLKSKIIIEGREVLPLSGISHKVSVLCNESSGYVMYNSDEHGFHNPQGLWNSGRVDIAALGDSFTEGFCVASDKNFVALIRDRYPKTLNLGMAGDGPLLMLATLQEYLQALKPKIVLWFHYEGNDLRDLGLEKNSSLLMRYLMDGFSQGLLYRQAEIDGALAAYVQRIKDEKPDELREFIEILTSEGQLAERIEAIVRLAHLRQRLGLVSQRLHKPDPVSKYSDVSELFTKVLARAEESVSAWGGKLYFVYLPEWEPFGNPGNVDGRREVVLEAVRTLGIPIIDIHRAFEAQRDPLALFPFRIDGHYNEEGHRVVAQEVLRSISVDNSN